MAAAVFVAGATLASISPVSLALQGVIVEHTEYSRATALYNAFYAAGMLMGPPVSSLIFAEHGGAAMLFHLAALWFAFFLFTIAFRHDDPAARKVEPVTTTTADAKVAGG
jgi:MFS family permease